MSNTSGRITELDTQLALPRAEQWLEDVQRETSDGTAKRKRISLEQFDQFLHDRYDTSVVTDIDSARELDELLYEAYPNKSLHEAGNDMLKRFSYWLEDTGMAHSTIPHRFYAVRTYLNEYTALEDIGYLDDEDNFILDWLDSGTKTLEERGERVHWLEIDKIEQLIESAKNLKNRLCIELLWNTGCRPSEVARMKERKTFPDERRIKVISSKIDDSDHNLYERNVFWSRSMDRTMREWRDRGGRESYSHSQDSEHLLVGYNTPSLSARQINNIVRMAADEAGLQSDMIQTANEDDDGNAISINRVTPKTLRHSFAVHSVRGREKSGTPSMDIERLRRLMGHRSIASTRFYLRFKTTDLRDAFDQCHPA